MAMEVKYKRLPAKYQGKPVFFAEVDSAGVRLYPLSRTHPSSPPHFEGTFSILKTRNLVFDLHVPHNCGPVQACLPFPSPSSSIR